MRVRDMLAGASTDAHMVAALVRATEQGMIDPDTNIGESDTIPLYASEFGRAYLRKIGFQFKALGEVLTLDEVDFKPSKAVAAKVAKARKRNVWAQVEAEAEAPKPKAARFDALIAKLPKGSVTKTQVKALRALIEA